MASIVVIALLSLGVLLFVAAPLLRSDAAERERVVSAESEAVDLESRQAMLVAALRDLEDDRATDKLDEDDYRHLHDKLSSEAVEVLKKIEELENRPAPAATLGPRALPRDDEGDGDSRA